MSKDLGRTANNSAHSDPYRKSLILKLDEVPNSIRQQIGR